MTNAKLMAENIAAGIKSNFNKTLTKYEYDSLLMACKDVMKEDIHGPKTKKYVASEVGKGNGFCHFEDISQFHFEDISLWFYYAVLKESAECISYLKDDKKMHLMYHHNMELAEYYVPSNNTNINQRNKHE